MKSIGGLVGGILGDKRAKGYDAQSRAELQNALEAYRGIALPTIEEQQLNYLLPELVGEYTPEMLEAMDLGPSAYEELSTDPATRDAQMAALQSLSNIGEEGFTEAEQADLNRIRRTTARESEAQRGKILQDMAQRGLAGSGVELASQLAAQQAASERMSEQADETAKMAFQRSLQAIQNAGNLGGNIRTQDYNEAQNLAEAKDQIARFNLQNAMQTQQSNVGAKNTAQQQNLANRQRIAEQQVNIKNQQQAANKDLIQQRFQNELSRASGIAGGYQNLANQSAQTAQAKRNKYTSIGSGIGGIADAAVNPLSSLFGESSSGAGGATGSTANKISPYEP